MPPPSVLSSVSTHTNPFGGSTSTPPHLDLTLPALTPQTAAVLPPALTLPHSSRFGMILSPASSPIPFRLVQRIQSGEFVEMRDLMADNVSLHTQLEDLHGTGSLVATPVGFRPRLREVPSLSSWMFCFATYMAVRTRDPATRDMLAYCRLIIREALRHGGNTWQDYDRAFRRQAAIDTALPWNTLLPGLQAATLSGPSLNRGGTLCTICREPDHNASQCALAIMQQPLLSVQGNPSRNPARPSRRFESGQNICASWNRGPCAFPGVCTYKHECAVCHLDHKGITCPTAPEGSIYHRLRMASRPATARRPLSSSS